MPKGFALGSVLAGCVGSLFVAAYATGMARAGLEGGLELLAFGLSVLTAPAAAFGALAGRLTMRFGIEAAFIVTGTTWALLCLPYGVLMSHLWRRTSAAH